MLPVHEMDPARALPLEAVPAPWEARALPRGVVWAALLVALVALVLLAWQVRTILTLLLVATTVAYILEPVVRRLVARTVVPRVVWAIGAGALVAAVEALALGWLLPSVAREALELARDLPAVAARLVERLDLGRFVDVPTATGGGAQWVGENMAGVARAAGRTVTAVALALLFPVLVALVVVHLPGAKRVLSLVPRAHRLEVRRLVRSMDEAVGGFFRGRIIICTIVGALLALGWWLCGVPHALALGVLGGALNLVPYASGLAAALAVLLGYASGVAEGGTISWLSVALWPAAVFAGVNLLENALLTPWIQSQAVNLSALTILLATLVGGALLGAVGLFYAIPVAVCVKTLLRDVALPRLRAWAEAH